MPELPEVETVRRGLAPHLQGQRLVGARVRQPALRWPVPLDLDARVREQPILSLSRRGKYLLVQLATDWLLVHLGMSGSLRLTDPGIDPGKHDHVDLLLANGPVLRYHDPRRFGAILLTPDPDRHPLLAPLGIEPLSEAFRGEWLYQASRQRRTSIKAFLMDAHTIAGIGNIYANEALFRAGIHPSTMAGRLSRTRCERLAVQIRSTLEAAIAAGGSSLRDFVDGQGNPGYFQQSYFVYGRPGSPCRTCGHAIRIMRQGNRATFYCPECQKR